MQAELDLRKRYPRVLPETLAKQARAAETRRIIAQAWADLSRGQLRLTLKTTKSVALNPLTGKRDIESSSSRGQILGVDGANQLMVWIAKLAEQEKIMIPSFVAPRLWRIAVEWAYCRDAKSFEVFEDVLPLPYRRVEKQRLSDEEAGYLDYLADERKQWRR